MNKINIRKKSDFGNMVSFPRMEMPSPMRENTMVYVMYHDRFKENKDRPY